MLRLSTADLSAALAGLSAPERIELLQLLEQREQLEAERAPDTRPSLADMAEQALQEAANQSGDAAAYLTAAKAHGERRDVHMTALQKQRPLADDVDAGAYVRWIADTWHEAGLAADRDGYPVVPPRSGAAVRRRLGPE